MVALPEETIFIDCDVLLWVDAAELVTNGEAVVGPVVNNLRFALPGEGELNLSVAIGTIGDWRGSEPYNKKKKYYTILFIFVNRSLIGYIFTLKNRELQLAFKMLQLY